MVFPETLEKIRSAYLQIPGTELKGWQLDPMGWNYNGNQETDDTDLHLLRGDKREAVTVQPEESFDEAAMQQEILSKMRAKGLI